MSKYLEVTYPNLKTDYPFHLVRYLIKNYNITHLYKKTLLDVGCGRDEYVDEFKNFGFYATVGVDKECNLEYGSLPYPKDSFNIVFTKSVIEHIFNTDNFMSECYRVLIPGGKIIVMTPDWECRYRDFFEDYTHIKPFTRKALQDLLKIYNFKKVEVKKFYQLPIVWKYPWLKVLCRLTSLLPDSFKWKNKEQTIHRTWIRFSKEKMLLGVGTK